MPKLTIRDRGKPRIYEMVEESVLIGRSQEAQVRLRDPEAAGVHCQIKKTSAGFRLVDLESKSGTKVNGRFVNQHTLRDGDRIEIGGSRILFQQKEQVVFEGSPTRRRLQRDSGPLSRIPGWGIGLIAACVALLVMAVVAIALSTTRPPAGAREARQADRLFAEERYDEALAVIRRARAAHEISPPIEEELRRIEEAIAGQRKSTREMDSIRECEASANALIRFANDPANKKKLEQKDEVLGRFERWLAENRDAPAVVRERVERNLESVRRSYKRLEASHERRNDW